MSFILSPNMNLPVPVVGQEPGPNYASDINNALSLIDSHNHASGSGVQVTPSGLDINTDLPFQGNNAISLRSARFNIQVTPLSGVLDLACIYFSGVDLYANDLNGNQIQITKSGGIAGTSGSIANLTSPASASYVAGSQTFVWQSAANTPANMDFASAIFRNLSAGSNGITVQAPLSLASSYSLTLPNLPGSQSFMTLDASGNISAPWTVDNSTLQVASNLVEVKPAGITYTQLAPLTFLNVDTSTTLPTVTPTPIIYTNVNNDTASGYNATTGVYTIPATGIYHISVSLALAGTTIGSGAQTVLYVYKNTNPLRELFFNNGSNTDTVAGTSGSTTESFVVGDTIQIYCTSNVSTALDGGSIKNFMNIVRLGS
jgi:hypothetical protein